MTKIDASIVAPLLKWYANEKRGLPWRKGKNPYHIWISEIMCQQTRIEAVIPYYERFIKEVPDIQTLANIKEERLLKLWEGLGYYSRARNLKIAANAIMNQHYGIFPYGLNDILALKGIGEYTAGAIASIAYDQKVPAVDGNVIRVYTRLTLDERNRKDPALKRDIEKDLMKIYPEEAGNFTQSLMELGALICLPNGKPKCECCPLSFLCRGYQNNCVMEFPKIEEKKKRKIEKRTILLLQYHDAYAIVKRSDKGLLASLWEFPNLEGNLHEEEVISFVGRDNILDINKSISYKHIFSHIEWHMNAYHVTLSRKIKHYTYFTQEEKEKYALPSAYQPFLKQLWK